MKGVAMDFTNKVYLKGFLNGQQFCAAVSREIDTVQLMNILSGTVPHYEPPADEEQKTIYDQGWLNAVKKRFQ